MGTMGGIFEAPTVAPGPLGMVPLRQLYGKGHRIIAYLPCAP